MEEYDTFIEAIQMYLPETIVAAIVAAVAIVTPINLYVKRRSGEYLAYWIFKGFGEIHRLRLRDEIMKTYLTWKTEKMPRLGLVKLELLLTEYLDAGYNSWVQILIATTPELDDFARKYEAILPQTRKVK